MRAITGEGFTFLNIPRTYYGLLEPALLTAGGVAGELLLATTEEEEQEQQKEEEEEERALPRALTDEEAEEVISALRRAGLVDDAGAVSLDALEEEEGGGKGARFRRFQPHRTCDRVRTMYICTRTTGMCVCGIYTHIYV